MAEKPRVIVTRRWPAKVEAVLRDEFDVELNHDDVALDADRLRDALTRADALCVTVTDRLDAGVLEAPGARARLLANFGVGYNHIDIAAARRTGMVVTNTPGVLTDCTADLAMTLLLMTARRTGEGERELRAGEWTGWRPTHLLGTRVTGKTLGIVGAGRIGLAVALRAHAGFGMKVLLASPSPVPRGTLDALEAVQVSLEALLAQSDFVSLHCPATPETRHLIDRQRLQLMQPHAILINTARGDVVDEAALETALRESVIAGAGLDVYEAEPHVRPGLLALPDVTLLPHLGSGSSETRVAMGMCAVENLRAYFRGEDPPNTV